jgi:PIN domain nuclease of toxin-antitoxin system
LSGEETLTHEALVAIAQNQTSRGLFISPISAWEIAIATRKSHAAGRPNLGEVSPERWFREAARLTGARTIPIRHRICCEAAAVVTDTGHKDPADCFLMATARARHMPLLTRDETILAMSATGYLDTIRC